MTNLFQKHENTLNQAIDAIHNRGYWSPYKEQPSPKFYGETADEDGKKAVSSYLSKPFELEQPGKIGVSSTEKSPYGLPVGISYPVCDINILIEAAKKAQKPWQQIGANGRVGVCLEILERINRRSFEIAHAVMLTTGQGWMMAFQAGGPHAQDRGLEAVAYAWDEMKNIPSESIWEKPQGKNPALVMRKNYEIIGRGVGLVIGCGTFPTWNTYPGLFAALATGNPVIVKPHSNAILPAAITVKIIREVLQEEGLDPNLVSLAVVNKREQTQALALHLEVKSIDFTGSNVFGEWLIANAKQAQVYAELAGVNIIVIESTDDYKGMLRNIAFTLSLYSGQMCTTTQTIIIPENGIETNIGSKSFDEIAQDLAGAIDKLLSDPAIAVQILGAIQSIQTLKRIKESAMLGKVILASRAIEHPDFPNAQVRTPLLLSCDAADEKYYMEERFGPISFLVKAKDRDAATALSEKIVREHGALTAGLYSNKPEYVNQMIDVSWRVGVALSINLTSGVYVNQSGAFSDYHGTGVNPSANASYSDSAFVANRFRVIQRRQHITVD
jgi:phenylacetic acid degradation protein paaN